MGNDVGVYVLSQIKADGKTPGIGARISIWYLRGQLENRAVTGVEDWLKC